MNSEVHEMKVVATMKNVCRRRGVRVTITHEVPAGTSLSDPASSALHISAHYDLNPRHRYCMQTSFCLMLVGFGATVGTVLGQLVASAPPPFIGLSVSALLIEIATFLGIFAHRLFPGVQISDLLAEIDRELRKECDTAMVNTFGGGTLFLHPASQIPFLNPPKPESNL